ncbi:MAG: UDP-N-acetylmuramoyl-tripeptide--D-alanyl-D-alanine ligase [Sulfuricella denitrificans]|nr:UDP-N-acetylmuramoyl-tripeptide--D-alanyl-D-alanine ligase [Sulfuricella denitrificans]
MLTLTQAAAGIQASMQGADVTFTSVTSDSRAITTGCLFVALRGERFDGHDFVTQAIRQGALTAMVDQAAAERHAAEWQGMPLLVVADTRLVLGQLAAFWRGRQNIRLVAVTGSNGKTTVKEMLAAILREAAGEQAVLATEGNLNNDIGMPLMLLKLREQHRFAVIEMGMNHPGEIEYLTRIARPDVAVINNAGAAHLAGLGSVEEVARAKGEIFSGLASDGLAVINADDAFAALWKKLAGTHAIIEFGLDHPAQVSAACQTGPLESELQLRTPASEFQVKLPLPGLHNVRNALAAAAAATALDIKPEAIAAGLEKFAGVKGRLQRKPGLHGATLIDDTYNANPASVKAAIAVLASMPGRKILVLGDMGELGPDADEMHRELGASARQSGVDILLCHGDICRATAAEFGANAWFFERIEELLADLENLLAPDVTVLVKGSRFMQMERVVKSFEVKGEK